MPEGDAKFSGHTKLVWVKLRRQPGKKELEFAVCVTVGEAVNRGDQAAKDTRPFVSEKDGRVAWSADHRIM